MPQFFKTVFLLLLKHFARLKLQSSSATVVGITGSVGKSSTVYMLDAVVRDLKRTKTTFGSNSESGLPLEILGLRHVLHNYSLSSWLKVLFALPGAFLFKKFNFEVFIAEMGIDSSRPPKNMSYLLEIITPDIGVFLSVAPSHTQQFAEELGLSENDQPALLRAIAHEKGKIVTTLGKGAHAVVTIDSPYIREVLPNISAHLTTVAIDRQADFELIQYTASQKGTTYEFKHGKKNYTVSIAGYILSREYAGLVMSVIAVSQILGIDIDQAIERLESNFTLPPGRMTLLPAQQGAWILDSSYNSSPEALRSVLQTVNNVKGFKRTVLILGDMRELGPLEAQAHRDFADSISRIADHVVLVGPKMKQYLLPELKKRKVSVQHFPHSLGVGKALLDEKVIRSGDLILVKGSQNTIFLEQTVEELMLYPEQAHRLLCRQEEHWDHDRQAYWSSLS